MKRKKLTPAMSSKTKLSKSTNKRSSSSTAAETAELTTSELHQHKLEPVNPLMNPVVLSVLFEVCSGHKDELKNYRLVCKMWHKESLPRWRKSMRLQACEYEPKRQFQPIVLKTRSRSKNNFHYCSLTMEELIKAVENRGNFGEYEFTVDHFRAFSLQLAKMTINESISGSCLPFWNSCALWMHELSVAGFAEKNYFSQLEIFLVKNLPNLKSLKLKIEYLEPELRGGFVYGNIRFNFDDENLNDNEIRKQEQLPVDGIKEHNNLRILEIDYCSKLSFPSLWDQFFRYFPNLQAITLNFRQIERDLLKYDKVEALLEAIHELRRQDKNKLCIKHFKLNDRYYDKESDEQISNGVVDLFTKLNLPLQTLELVLESGTPADPVAKIISCHSTTLKSLSLFRDQSDIAFPNFPFGAPVDNLTTLKLYGVIAANLSFLRYTPNLQELYMSVDTETVYSDSGNRIFGLLEGKYDFISETIKYCDMSRVNLLLLYKLELRFPIEGSSNMKSLTSWMPNVQLFAGKISPGCFSVMCECEKWKHSLRELRLEIGNGIDDEVITGIPLKSKRLSRKSSLEVSKLPGNITYLKNLQVCEMQKPVLAFRKTICSHLLLNITDISIREGFMKLPLLRELKLTVSEELTETSRTELEQKQIKLYVHVSNSCSCGHYETRLTRSRHNQ